MFIITYDEFILHWMNNHFLSEKSLADIKSQIDIILNFQKRVRIEKHKLNRSVAYTNKHMPNLHSVWANNQSLCIEMLEMRLHYHKDILSTMLSHIHFRNCKINAHHSSLLSLPRIQVRYNKEN